MSSEWRKSSYSSGGQSACVEVAKSDVILVRDTTDRDGCTLSVPAWAWSRFLGALR
jgi:hypothetical protein